MKKTYLIGGGMTLLAAAILVGCNSNDDNGGGRGAPTTTTLTVTPSLGKILNAKVILRNARTGAQLGAGNTGNSGSAKLTVPRMADPVVVEVQSAGATYFDESKKAEVELSSEVEAGSSLHTVLPSLTAATTVGVTSLTDIAYKMAVKKAAGETKLSAALVDEANLKVGQALAPELIAAGKSILLAPKVVGSTADLSSLDNSAASLYALRLAALVNLVSSESEDSSPAITVLETISDDLVSDGKLDGKLTNGMTTALYSLENFSAKLNANLTALQAQFATNVTVNLANTFALDLSKFDINLVNIGITIGGGTGSGCVATISGVPVIGTYKVCYKNFPQNAICNSSNPALSGISSVQVPGVSGTISWTFAAGSCEGALVTFDYATGSIGQ